jgi:hypothetical protein
MNLSSIRTVLLALLLLLAQVGASAHSLTHLQKQPDGGLSGGACEWCLAYSQLDGPPTPAAPVAIGRPPHPAPVSAPVTEPLCVPQRPAYHSQAPPILS